MAMAPNKIQQLYELHQQLRTVDSKIPVDQTASHQLRQRIRAMLPPLTPNRDCPLDSGTSWLPQKKTPQGQTGCLHMNYTRNRANEVVATELAHLRFFAQTAQSLGLQLEILTPVTCRADVETELAQADYDGLDYRVILSQQPISKWAEDSVEYLENGQIAVLTPVHDELLIWAMQQGRRQRWQGLVAPDRLEAVLEDDHAWIPLGVRVNSSATGYERARIAQEQGLGVRSIRAYIEGGNMIAGEDHAGQPVILVGKDAIATTAQIYQLHEAEVRQVICDDFGLSRLEQVIAVEQPGQFHLDMGLLFIGYGTVILNDSRPALDDALEMAELAPCETTKAIASKRQLQCQLEAQAEIDLVQAGFTVIRQTLENDTMYNFFNGEFVETADHCQYYLTNGGPAAQQAAFETLMVHQWQVVNQVCFSPQNSAQKSLQERGGVGCRIKGSRRSPH